MTNRAHLAADVLVDVIDGRAETAALAHLETCAACRTRLDEARAALALAAEAEVPEPSPLFWDHFSARVSAAVADEPVRGAGWRAWWQRRWLVGAVAASAAVVTLAVVVPNPWRASAPAPASVPGATPAAPLTADVSAAASEDEGWAVVAALSDELAADAGEAEALEPGPGAAERAVGSLDADEQNELVRLLEAELARRPS